MKFFPTIVFVGALFTLCGCHEKKEDKAFRVFNEGVALSLDAADLQEKGETAKAITANNKAIAKFKETILIDSSHKVARSALGHSYFVAGQYEVAVKWHSESIRIDGEDAASYREMGLAKLMLGKVLPGKADREHFFVLDKTPEDRTNILLDLVDVADHSYATARQYRDKDDKNNTTEYTKLAICVLMMVHEYDNTQKEVAAKIAKYATELGEQEVAEKYQKLSL